jgi:hypothetical protein
MPIGSGELSLWLELTITSVIPGRRAWARLRMSLVPSDSSPWYALKIPWETTDTRTTVLVPSENATARASIGSWTSAASWLTPLDT